MGWKCGNSEHHCAQVDELDSEGHELAPAALKWPRRAAWTSASQCLRSMPPKEKSLTKTTTSQLGRKVNCQIEKVGSRCGQVGVEVVECQEWAPKRLDSRCWRAWTVFAEFWVGSCCLRKSSTKSRKLQPKISEIEEIQNSKSTVINLTPRQRMSTIAVYHHQIAQSSLYGTALAEFWVCSSEKIYPLLNVRFCS